MTYRRMEETSMSNPATNNSTTDLVHALFGSVVGECLAEYACSYHRQSAKLYVTDKKFLVYSNVLGFERRLCLDWNEVDIMELYRTTSIRVCTIDGDEFVVRSLVDRESTLRQLQQVKRAENNRFGTLIGHQFPTSPPRASGLPRAVSSGGRLPALPEQSPLRRRASSAPVVTVEEANATPARRGSHESAPTMPAGNVKMVALASTASSTPPGNRPHLTSVGSVNSSSTIHESLEQSWQHCKQQQREPKDQVAIELQLSWDLDSFFFSFLADEAPHSFPKFQETAIGDSNIEVTPWKLMQASDGETRPVSAGGDQELLPSIFTRTITFTHPIASVPLMGPTSALARREQILKRFGAHGLLLEMATYVQGIPASDCMYVDVRWIVEPVAEQGDGGGVKLTVLHQTRFTKSTMLRKVICTSTKSELTTWYAKYRAMLEDVARDEEEVPEPPTTPVQSNGKHHGTRQVFEEENSGNGRVEQLTPPSTATKQQSPRMPSVAFGVAAFVVAIMTILMLVISNWILSQHVTSLEAEMRLLRSELRTLTSAIAQRQHADSNC